MELYAVDAAHRIGERRRAAIGVTDEGVPFGKPPNPVTVGHPHRDLFPVLKAVKEIASTLYAEARAAVFAVHRRLHMTAEELGGELGAVANAEDRHAEVVKHRSHAGRALVVAARRSA